jgi:hypothetical protein
MRIDSMIAIGSDDASFSETGQTAVEVGANVHESKPTVRAEQLRPLCKQRQSSEFIAIEVD